MHETSTHRPSPRACTLGGVLPSTPVDPSKPLVDVQQHHILKPGANKCRLRDFPHANKCDLLNLEILQLIQLSWGIEDFSSAFFFQNSNFLGTQRLAQNIFAAFGPVSPNQHRSECAKNGKFSAGSHFHHFGCFQTILSDYRVNPQVLGVGP